MYTISECLQGVHNVGSNSWLTPMLGNKATLVLLLVGGCILGDGIRGN